MNARALIPETFATVEEFERTLSMAEEQAQGDFETEFVENIRERYTKFGGRMYFSPKQEQLLDRIAWGNEDGNRI